MDLTSVSRATGALLVALVSQSALGATLQVVVPGPYAENGGTSTFDVRLLRDVSDAGVCQVDGEVTAPVGSPVGNAAEEGIDYASFSFSFNLIMQINDNVATQTFPITINDDALYEGAVERISFNLGFIDTSLCPGITVQVIQGDNVGTIAENETPQFTLGFTQANTGVAEGDGTIDYLVDFLPGNLAPGTFDITASVASTSDTATSGADFQQHNATYNFQSADPQGGSVAIIDDSTPEGTERFTLDLSAVLSDREGAQLTVSPTQPQLAVDIVDNDGGTPGFIEFSQSTYTVDEGAGNAIITMVRTGGTTGPATATVSADLNSGDDATIGLDFTPSTVSVSWVDGDSAPKTLLIPILEDTVVEPTETFSLSITAVLGAQQGNLSSATVGITDNDDQVDPGPDESVDGASGESVAVTFAVTGAAPFTLTSDIGTVTPATLPAPGNATFSFDIPSGTPTGTTISATITVANANGTPATKTVTITVVDPDRVLAEVPGLTPNQRALAVALDSLCPRLALQQVLDDDQGQLLDACNGLRDAATSDEQIRVALDAINPEELIVAATTTLRLASMQNGNLTQRINALRSGATGLDLAGLNLSIGDHAIAGATLNQALKSLIGRFTDGAIGGGASADDFARWGLFANGNIKFGDKDKTENEAAFDYDTIGITTGVDYRFRDNLVFGAALGYASVESDFTGGKGELDISAWSASVFGTYFVADRFYLDGMITYGQNDYDTTREISYSDGLGVVEQTADGDTDGMQLSGGLSGGYDFTYGPWTVGPHLGGFYIDVDVDRFAESGAGGYNLVIGDQNAQSFQLNAGGHASVVLNRAWGVLIPHARLDYVHELMDSAEMIGVSLASDPFATDPSNPTPVIRLRTDRPDADYFVLSLGASAQFVNGVSGFVNYRTMAAYDDFTMNEFTWGLRFERAF